MIRDVSTKADHNMFAFWNAEGRLSVCKYTF